MAQLKQEKASHALNVGGIKLLWHHAALIGWCLALGCESTKMCLAIHYRRRLMQPLTRRVDLNGRSTSVRMAVHQGVLEALIRDAQKERKSRRSRHSTRFKGKRDDFGKPNDVHTLSCDHRLSLLGSLLCYLYLLNRM